jgi:hypothetical protein
METKMNKTLGTILLVLTIVILAGAIFFAGTVYSRWNMMSGWTNNGLPGSGMMGQGGMMNGMMSSDGGMMHGNGSNNPSLAPLTIEQAKAAAEKYLSGLENSDLTIAEIMIFDNHAYVVVKEESTGVGALELLIDPASQAAYPEHGPNMMWNLKYGLMNHQNMMRDNAGMMGMMGGNGGMMNMTGGWDNTATENLSLEMSVTPEQANELAQQYLDANLIGAAPTAFTQFYGYYTIDFEKDGGTAGMLSVNGYSGQVFLHTWHGAFIEEVKE